MGHEALVAALDFAYLKPAVKGVDFKPVPVARRFLTNIKPVHLPGTPQAIS